MSRVVNGYWFYGLSGSGKSFASKFLAENLNNSFIIDGDAVRAHLSFDLGYSIGDRKVQLKRLLGLSKITISNGYIPVTSSVLMTSEISLGCSEYGIKVIEILRPFDQIRRVRSLYDENEDVVGVDIAQTELQTEKLYNSGENDFLEKVKRYVDQKV
jgi:hypothetical protein